MIYCPKCGSPNKQKARHCHQCGHHFKGGKGGLLPVLICFILLVGVVAGIYFMTTKVPLVADPIKWVIKDHKTFSFIDLHKDYNPIKFFANLKNDLGYQAAIAVYKIKMGFIITNDLVVYGVGILIYMIMFLILSRFIKKAKRWYLFFPHLALKIINYAGIAIIALFLIDYFAKTALLYQLACYILMLMGM